MENGLMTYDYRSDVTGTHHDIQCDVADFRQLLRHFPETWVWVQAHLPSGRLWIYHAGLKKGWFSDEAIGFPPTATK